MFGMVVVWLFYTDICRAASGKPLVIVKSVSDVQSDSEIVIQKEVIGGPLEIVPGPGGDAFVVQDKPKKGLRIIFTRGFPAQAGTLSFWVCPLDWCYDDEKFHMFANLACYPADTEPNARDEKTVSSSWLLYKYMKPYASGNALLLLYNDRNKNSWTLGHRATEMTDWKPGIWHHLAVTWKAADRYPSCALYVDGVRTAETNSDWHRFDFSGQAVITFGASWGNEGRTAICHVMLYGERLTEEEMGTLYAEEMEAWANHK